MARVLMVAEKPSIAKSIADALGSNYSKRSGISKVCPVYEYKGSFFGEQVFFLVTSVCGHLYSRDFPRQYNNWESIDPLELYDVDTVKVETPTKGGSLIKHLQHEANSCTYLVLWLDCDREGENICFEVIETVKPLLRKTQYQQIYRAKFSSLTSQDLRKAMENLGTPNQNEALSVDARQILDLKVGVSFTRFQTRFFQGKYGNLDSKLISYGPCQTPTLGFCVKRHDEILSFRPEPFYTVVLVSRSQPSVRFHHIKGHIKHQPAAQVIFQKLNENKNAPAIITSIEKSAHKVKKPLGLNTVQLLKLGSTQLGLSPHTTLSIAEHLYLSGFITYPRTESTAYASSFDLMGVVRDLKRVKEMTEHCEMLLNGEFKKPHKGVDNGDHPPITPCSSEVNGLDKLHRNLFDLIAWYFLATVSQDSTYEKVVIRLVMLEEEFRAEGSITKNLGFGNATPWLCAKEKELPSFSKGDVVIISNVELNTDYVRFI
jgi:DNA topoisomerase-3